MQRSPSRFGLSDEDWDVAKAQLRAAIVRSAEEGSLTSYSDVARQVTAVRVDPHSSLMNHLLGDIFREEHTSGRPALTVIVGYKDGDRKPGPGFYDMAKELRIEVGDRDEFWVNETKRVFDHFGTTGSSRRRPRSV